MRRMKHLYCLVFFVMLGFGGYVTADQAGAVTFSDRTFNDSDWDLTVLFLLNGGVVTASQQFSGGNPDEHRRIVNRVNPSPQPGESSGVWGFHKSIDAVYDPQIHGAISSINYTEDSIMFVGSGEGQATGAALLQSGKVYFAHGLLANQTSWTTQTQGSLTAEDFSPLLQPDDHPDFSALGELITFGFFRANSTRGGEYFRDAGIDNWSVTINPVTRILTISPPSGSYITTQGFDLTLIVEVPGLSVVGGSATSDGSDVTGALVSCVIPGILISGGQTFRCPGLTGGTFGTGHHTLSVTLDLSDGSSVSDTVTWEVKENTEP